LINGNPNPVPLVYRQLLLNAFYNLEISLDAFLEAITLAIEFHKIVVFKIQPAKDNASTTFIFEQKGEMNFQIIEVLEFQNHCGRKIIHSCRLCQGIYMPVRSLFTPVPLTWASIRVGIIILVPEILENKEVGFSVTFPFQDPYFLDK